MFSRPPAPLIELVKFSSFLILKLPLFNFTVFRSGLTGLDRRVVKYLGASVLNNTIKTTVSWNAISSDALAKTTPLTYKKYSLILNYISLLIFNN